MIQEPSTDLHAFCLYCTKTTGSNRVYCSYKCELADRLPWQECRCGCGRMVRRPLRWASHSCFVRDDGPVERGDI